MGWFPGWYVTRLHCGPPAGKAVCGAYTSVPRLAWQIQRVAKDVQKCKRCLKALDGSTANNAERFLVSCTVEIPAASPDTAAAALRRHLPSGWGLASPVVVRDSAGNSVEILTDRGVMDGYSGEG